MIQQVSNVSPKMSSQTIQYTPLHAHDKESKTFFSLIRVYYLDFFTDLYKNLKIVVLINSYFQKSSIQTHEYKKKQSPLLYILICSHELY